MEGIRANVSSEEEIEYLIRARYPLLYVTSTEEERVEKNLRAICERRNRRFVTWSCTEGFQGGDGDTFNDIRDPQRAMEHIFRYENDALFVLRDFHPYLRSAGDPSFARFEPRVQDEPL